MADCGFVKMQDHCGPVVTQHHSFCEKAETLNLVPAIAQPPPRYPLLRVAAHLREVHPNPPTEASGVESGLVVGEQWGLAD